MTEDLATTVVTTYLKQLRLSRMARDCEALAREAEQRGLGYLGYKPCSKANWLSGMNSSCVSGSKPLLFLTRSAWRTLTFRWCLASPRFGSWNWRKEPSWRLTTMCSSLAPAALGKPI